MRDDLLHYYERELTYLRRMGAEFAQRYPKVAGRLLLEPSKCEDPHVERLLEAFAFLAARVHYRIDEEMPEISESLLGIVYPQYVRPLPSMSLVELRLDQEQGKLTSGHRVPRESLLLSRPVDGVPCKFRTCYDTTLWPVTVAAAQWVTPDRLKPAVRLGDAVAALRVELRCFPDVNFGQLQLEILRVHLNGESNVVFPLYELLCNNCRQILVRELPSPGAPPLRTLTLPGSAVRPVGFAADEGMLPYPGRSFLGYRLLQEYFAFPEKYLFLDVAGFDEIRLAGMGGGAGGLEIIFAVSPFERAEWKQTLEASVSASTLRLGCTPVVNLFPQVSEPIVLTQRRHEYQVIADARRRLTTEIFSIENVMAVTPDSTEPLRFEPFYAHRHGAGPAAGGAYWMAKRRPSGWRSDAGTDVFLSFVELTGRVAHPDQDVATARLTCFNSDLPSRLPFGNERGDFEMEGGGPVRGIVALAKPTRVIQPPLGSAQLWRLISLLSLNYLSLGEGPDALRELLRLHDFSDAASVRKQIQGVADVRSEPAFARIASEQGLSFVRGRRVEVDLNEEEFTGGGVYLFASVLEHFLGLYASINSFSVLAARARERKGVIREWAPRAGWKPLL